MTCYTVHVIKGAFADRGFQQPEAFCRDYTDSCHCVRTIIDVYKIILCFETFPLGACGCHMLKVIIMKDSYIYKLVHIRLSC